MPEHPQGLLQDRNLQRLLQHRHQPVAQDVVEQRAVRVTRDNHDGQIRMRLFRQSINFISRDIGKLKIEEAEVELLLFQCGERFASGADNDTGEALLLEEKLERGLQAFVVIDDED